MVMNLFRSEYRELSPDENALISEIKEHANRLVTCLVSPRLDARMRSLAMTNLEQSVMWAVKGITG